MTLSRQANRRSRSLRQQRRKGHKAAGYVRGSAPNKMEKACEASVSPPARCPGAAGHDEGAPARERLVKCGWRDSNSHAVRHQILSLACLPFQHTRKWSRKYNTYSLYSSNKSFTLAVAAASAAARSRSAAARSFSAFLRSRSALRCSARVSAASAQG